MKSKYVSFLSACFAGVMLFASGENLLENGDFQKDANGDGWPDGWSRNPGVVVEKDGDNIWLSVSKSYQSPKFVIDLDPTWAILNFKAKLKATDVLVGRKTWQDGKVSMSFVGADGKMVGGYPRSASIRGTQDWTDYEFQLLIPEGAKGLKGSLVMFGPSGKVEFDDVVVTVAEHNANKKVEKQESIKVVEKPRILPVGTELVINGDFVVGSEGWRSDTFPTLVSDNGNQVVEILKGKSLYQLVEIPEETESLLLKMRMKSDGIVKGKESWHDGRLAMAFKDINGKQVGGWPRVFYVDGTTGWTDCEREYEVPTGATVLELNGCVMGTSGKLYFDDISVTIKENFKPAQPTKCPIDATKVWSYEDVFVQNTPTRTKICLNGFWKFLPEQELLGDIEAPAVDANWGWFKVPGVWPNKVKSYEKIKTQAQDFILDPSFSKRYDLHNLQFGWYERELTVPAHFAGRRVLLDFEMVQAQLIVFVDGKKVDLLKFPGGQIDITDFVRPGQQHRLDVLLIAKPFKNSATVVMDVTNVFEVDAKLKFRGITGDVFLLGIPKDVSIDNIRFTSDTDDMKLTTDVSFRGKVPVGSTISVDIQEDKKLVKKGNASKVALKDNGYTGFTEEWADVKLWDINTPQNLYYGIVSLKDKDGKLLDKSFPVRFGFREFKIVGKDFYLNGERIHWRTLMINNVNAPADLANKQDVLSTLETIKEYGFNSVITHNYGFNPGGVTYMQSILDATDESGIMLSFSLPHGKDFDWNFSDPTIMAEYLRISEYLINKVWNHPATVLYAMNHNQCGYRGDLNPMAMDGVFSPEYGKDVNPTARRIIAEKLATNVKKIDSSRPVYHHSSGNLGDIYSNNIYLNWSPMQERSDWTQYWSTNSVKPIFFVEFGLPHVASWSSYRGPNFIWRTFAQQSVWDSEFSAAFMENDAYVMTPSKEKQLQHEERLWEKSPNGFHWGYLCQPLRSNKTLYHNITAMFVENTWRNLRGWGTTAILPWDQERLEEPVNRISEPVENPSKYKNLKHPGIVPDYYLPVKDWLYERKKDEFEPEVIGNAFMRWNQPIIAWIAGNASHFTAVAVNFIPGGQVAKQIAVINDSREPVTVKYTWNVQGMNIKGIDSITVDVGAIEFRPINFLVPKDAVGSYKIVAAFDINGKKSDYSFDFNVIPHTPKPKLKSNIAVYDPEGDTVAELKQFGVKFDSVRADADLSKYSILVVGRKALGGEERIKDINLVEQGLNVIVFAQESSVLQDKLGFRINEHGLRRVFIRDQSSSMVDGLSNKILQSWQGESTTLPQFIVDRETLGNPAWQWAGFRNTRVWRNQNWGNVAHSLIEKPPVGNFMPIIDGGFELQYTSLMEYRQGKGSIIFCQVEVIGRTVQDPAAEKLLANILSYVDTREPSEFKKVYYLKDKNVEQLLSQLNIGKTLYTGAENIDNAILVVGPESEIPATINAKSKAGTAIFGLALSPNQIKILTAGELQAVVKDAKSMPVDDSSDKIFAGLSSAEFYLKTLRLKIPVIVDNNDKDKTYLFKSINNGEGTIVLSQVAPWQFDYMNPQLAYLRTTYRRGIYMVSRVLKNLGADSKCDIVAKLNADKSLYYQPLHTVWKGITDPENNGEALGYLKPDFDDSAWREFKVPGNFESQYKDISDYDGYFWYRTKFDKPREMTSEDITFLLGAIDDESQIWLNGKFLGEITKETNPDDYWMAPRVFEFNRDDFKEKDNLLIIRVNDTYKAGGIMQQPVFKTIGPWLDSYYIQVPDANDDPYRFYRW